MANQPPNQLAVRRSNFMSVVTGDGFKKQLALALPKHVTAERLMRIVLTQMNKNPGLFECTPESVMGGIMQAGQMGLEIDGKKAALVPFNNRGTKIATLIVGYQGYIELAYRHPKVTGVRGKVVYAKDYFDYDEGLTPRLVHKPYEGDDDPGPLKYAYAICNLDGGGATFVVVNRREVMKAKESARGKDRPDSPWNTHEASMWLKTAVRRLSPFMPQSSEMSDALASDGQAFVADKEGARAIELAGSAMVHGSVGATLENGGTTAIEDASQEQQQERQEEQQHDPADEDGRNVETETPTKTPPPNKGAPTIDELRKEIKKKLGKINCASSLLIAKLEEREMIPRAVPFDELTQEQLQAASDAWEDLEAELKPQK